jgi:hypothetical protein
MNDLAKINEWVNNSSDYATGLELYNRYKPNTKFDDYFSRMASHPDGAAVNLLKQKLIAIQAKLALNPVFLEQKIIENSTRTPIVGKQETPPLTQKYINKAEKLLSNSPQGKIDSANIPQHLQADYARIQEITPMLGGLHAKLKASTDSSEAKSICDEIVSLDTEKRTLWAKIDDFNGLSPDERDKVLNPNPNNDRIIELGKKLKITRDSLNRKMSDITKHRKNKKHELAAKGEEKAKEYQQIIDTLEAEIASLSGNNA